MKFTQAIKEVLTGKKPLIDVYHFLLGNYRYKLYYSKDSTGAVRAYGSKHPLMRQHIWEQIKYRIKNMNTDCFSNGSCIHCGCNTTELQMANKPCKGLEYPPMMNKDNWRLYQKSMYSPRYRGYTWMYQPIAQETLLFKETHNSHVQLNRSKPGGDFSR
jgi:hypothetical protein